MTHGGSKVNGVVEAFNEMDAVRRIKENCELIVKLQEVKERKGGFFDMEVGGSKMDSKAFSMMCSQFAIMLDAGIPLARVVKLVADKAEDKKMHKLLDKVAADVEGGRNLSTSFDEHGSGYIPITFIETLRAGEATGNLAGSFRSMQEHYEKDSQMKSKVKSALSYPIFVLVVAVVVVAVLMVRVVPVFTSMFTEMGGEVPILMRILIAISEFFTRNIMLMVVIVLICIIIVRVYGLTETGKTNLAHLRLKMPVFGKIEELNAASQFANTMAAMLGAGLPIVRAVTITTKVISNYYLSGQTGRLVAQLESGRSLSASMRDITDYPDILIDMVGVGESSGEPERTLGLTANYYDTELEEATKAAVAKLEPTLLIVLAVIVGFIVMAVFTAMFDMYSMM